MREIHVGVEGGISVHVLYNDFKRVYNISKQMPLVCVRRTAKVFHSSLPAYTHSPPPKRHLNCFSLMARQ